jgi:hypothetical protein
MDSKEPQSSQSPREDKKFALFKKGRTGKYGPIGYNNYANYLREKCQLKDGETWLSRAQRPLTQEEKEAHAAIEEVYRKLGFKSLNQSGSMGISGS